MGYRKGKGGGEGSTGGTNLVSIILGAITIVLALIGLGIAMDTIAPLLTGGGQALNWTRYPGGEPMLKLFPLIMLVGLVIFGGIMVWLGTRGKAITVKDTIFTVIVVVVAVIMLPIVMSACDTAYDNANASVFTGLQSFLGLVPLIYTVGLMFVSGLLGRRVLQGGA
jgi:hypothetical protein